MSRTTESVLPCSGGGIGMGGVIYTAAVLSTGYNDTPRGLKNCFVLTCGPVSS